MPSKDTKVIVKEIIEMNRKVEKLRLWQGQFDFLDGFFKNTVKTLIIVGMVIAYYKKDMMLIILFIGIFIVALGFWGKGEVKDG